MSRSARFGISIVGIILGYAVLYFIADNAGGALAKNFIGGHDVKLSEWKALYTPVVMAVAALTALVHIGWCVAAEFLLKVSSPFGTGKRAVWVGALIASGVFCVAYPLIRSLGSAKLVMSPIIYLLFIALFTLFGFWFGSIFSTPNAYKYTPLGAKAIRTTKGRK